MSTILIKNGTLIDGSGSKRYLADILIENNSSTGIKYSINGEPYKTLDTGKKAMGTVKGIDNVIFIKTNDDKVIEKDLPSDDVNIFINEIINNSENWYKENTENQ